jgi:hypothetical protein
MRYKALAYQGVYWLKDLGTFDTFDEAQQALFDNEEKYCGPLDSEEYEINHEAYWFDSRIEEITDVNSQAP